MFHVLRFTLARHSADWTGRCGGLLEHRAHEIVVDLLDVAIADTALTDRRGGKVDAVLVQDIFAQQVEGNVVLLTVKGNFDFAVTAITGHTIGHAFDKTGQCSLAEAA